MAAVEADLILNVDQALAQVEQLGADITAATSDVVLDVQVETDTSAAEAEIQSIDAELVEVPVEADVSAAEAQIEGLGDSAEGASGGVSGLSESFSGLTDSIGETALAGSDLASSLGGLGGTGAAVTGIGALTAAAFELIGSFGEAEAVAARTALIIENTGGNAGVTAEHVADLAGQIRDYSGFSDEAIASGANLVLGMENVRNAAGANNDIFDRLIRISADYAAFTGGDVTSATQRFGRALNDPVRGLSLLRRSGVTFTEEQQALVTSLVESGDSVAAQAVLLDALEGRYEGTARALGELTEGGLERAKEGFSELGEAAGGILAPGLEAAVGAAGALTDAVNLLGGALGDIPGLGEGGSEFGLSDILEQANPLNLIDDLELIRDGFQGLTDGGSLFSETIGKGFTEIEESAPKATEATDALTGATDESATSWEREAAAIQSTTDAISAYLDETFGVEEARDQLQESFQGLLNSVVENGQAFRGDTEAARENRQAMREVVQGHAELISSLIENNASQQELQNATDNTIGRLRAARGQGLITAGAFRRLRDDVLAVPTSVGVHVESNVDFVRREFDLLAGSIANAGAVAAGHSADFHAVAETPRVGLQDATHGGSGGGDVIITVDARGATDPAAVGAAVTEAGRALAQHRRKLNIRTNLRSG